METIIQYLHSNKKPSLKLKRILIFSIPFLAKRIKYCLRYKIIILKPVTLCFVSYIIRGNKYICFSLDYASLWSLGDWFETRIVGNPEDRLSRNEAHLMVDIHLN